MNSFSDWAKLGTWVWSSHSGCYSRERQEGHSKVWSRTCNLQKPRRNKWPLSKEIWLCYLNSQETILNAQKTRPTELWCRHGYHLPFQNRVAYFRYRRQGQTCGFSEGKLKATELKIHTSIPSYVSNTLKASLPCRSCVRKNCRKRCWQNLGRTLYGAVKPGQLTMQHHAMRQRRKSWRLF